MSGRPAQNDRPALARRSEASLRPDPARIVARLFLPGEELLQARPRAGAVVDRVLALPEKEVEELADRLLESFTARHRSYIPLLASHADIVGHRVGGARSLSRAREIVLGATFTAEYAVEGAALCNPSAVLHPDQGGLASGQARVVVSLRGIGEGHLSSIGFAVAIVGPGEQWTFQPRPLPVVSSTASPNRWRPGLLHALLADQGPLDALAGSVLRALPRHFTAVDLERVIAETPVDLLTRLGAPVTIDLLRRLVASGYETRFPPEVDLAQQVLLPVAAEESNGMEDARFVRFVDLDGRVDYRATYTAYDGHRIAPRLLTSPDLRVFSATRMAGPAARNKGMALFPRRVDGRHLALCRSDGESTSLTSSVDGLVWEEPRPIHGPELSWEVLQVGNCGPPIETDRGWLVLTHGVGPMRVYAIGAVLLDLADPTRMLARLTRPLLSVGPGEQEGYVPNVVYSCGGVMHAGLLWIPYGVGDARIGVAYVPVEELLDAMSPVAAAASPLSPGWSAAPAS